VSTINRASQMTIASILQALDSFVVSKVDVLPSMAQG